MRFFLTFFSICFFLFSCSEDKSHRKYVLKEKSEMAQMMLDMHSNLAEIQKKIKSGEDLGNFPAEYANLPVVDMTDESMRAEGFEAYALHLIASEKELFEAETPQAQETAYKNVVNSCINCHTNVGCKGPIPKIEKLRWTE